MRSFRYAVLLAACAVLLAAPSARAEVRAWEGTITIPTYLLGEEDPNPPFPMINRHNIYPYTMLDDLTDKREPKSYKAIYLENEFLKATVLPEMGGRLYSLYDKVNKREVFYRNNVVKYGLVALRGAWISGGIEWNFPNGHTVVTVSPVASMIRQNPDGSVTAVVGDVDRVTEMHWEIALTLRRGVARLEQRVTLFNPTPLTNLYWFWATAAVPATEDMQFIYPMREAYPHTKGVVWSYPMHDGTDWSWYKNVREPTSLFARQVHRSFFGAYYHKTDYGVVHVADFHDVPGKKTWTWGVADDGLIWTNLLTDNDGAYNEIQAGRYETQLNYEFIPPRRVEQFTEYWYPVRGLGGGWVEATEQLAFNVQLIPASGSSKPQAEVTLSPTIPLAAPRVRLLLGSRLLHDLPLPALAPLKPAALRTALDDFDAAQKGLVVEIYDGRLLMARWSAANPIDGNPDFVAAAGKTFPPRKPRDKMSVEELFLAGVEEEKDGDEDAAARIYSEVLKRDPGYIPALLKHIWLSYRAGNFEQAEAIVATALARNASDPSIHYAAGVVHRASQRWGMAQDSFWSAIRYGGLPAPAYAQLGEIAIRQKHFDEAAKLLRQALSFNPDDALVLSDLAVALRLGGKTADAAKAADQALAKMPLLPFAMAEKAQVVPSQPATASAQWKKALGHDVENYLEVAAWYRRLDDHSSVRFVLGSALKDLPVATISPLVYHYLASSAREEGKENEAREFAQRAAAAPVDKVFPNRIEDALVLDEAVRQDPTDAHAAYLLGNFLFARGRYETASRMWFQALGLGFESPVLYRNLGVNAWHVKKDLEAAAGFYAKAIELAPREFRLYVDLDEIYAELNEPEKRQRMFAQAPPEVLGRDAVRLRRALLDVQLKQYDQALEVLKAHHFKPYEGGVAVRQVFVAANLAKGKASMAAGKFQAAAEAFRRAAEYPENLGVGKPNEPHDEAAFYWLGEALQAAGASDEARSAWQQAAKGGKRIHGPARAYQAAALLKLGHADDSEKIATSLLNASSQASPGASTFYSVGLLEALGGKPDVAKEYFQRALEADPAFWQARIELER
ncbi:MAG: DUF5107 domain-containing protein [Terriglobia bacterium]